MQSKQFRLKSRPEGLPTPNDFELVEVETRSPDAGEVLVENAFMSVDPYMRGRMREAWGPGDDLEGGAIGRVLESNFDDLSEGDYVSHGLGWR